MFRIVALGTLFVTAFSMLVQIIGQVGSYFSGASLQKLLFVVYGLVLLVGVGYWFIALGVRKLKKIETV